MVKVVLLSALLLAVVRFFTIPWRVRQLSAQTESIPLANTRTVTPDTPALERTRDYSDILRYNVFGTPQDAAESNHPGPETPSPADEGTLGIELLGTVSGHPLIARAIVRESGTSSTSIHKLGDIIHNAVIKEINRDSMTVNYQGRDITLRRLTRTPAEIPALPPKPDLKQDDIQPQSPQSPVVEQLLTRTTLTPYEVDGQVQGIRITGLDKIPLAGVLGLKEGDVIHTVNGQTLTSKQKAFQVLKKAKSQQALDIELLRDGQSTTLSFPIR